MTDRELVVRSLAGDGDAYAALVRRHFRDAFDVARRLTLTAEDAEDACQDAFARAYFRLDQCGDADRFRGWLLTIVRHHAHNVRRYQALRDADSLDAGTIVAPDSTSRDVEQGDLRERLRSALGVLTPVKRAVVRHHDIDGWTHPQIAGSLGISVTMSRRHLSDAHAMLRSRLQDAARDFLEGAFDD